MYAAYWADSSGAFWLWSGYGSQHDGDLFGDYLEDLWRLDKEQQLTQSPHWTQEQAHSQPMGKTWTNTWATQGDLWLISGFGSDTKIHSDMWHFSSASRTWTLLANYSHLGGVYNCTAAGGAPPAPTACALHPGARENGYTMTSDDGRLWLFGGSGYAFDSSKKGGMNDLWSFDVKASLWSFEGGHANSWSATGPKHNTSFSGGAAGEHGTLGVPAPTNLPGADHAGYSWREQVNGSLWVFGGENGETDSTGLGLYSDLWSVDPATKDWTWESGPATQDQAGDWIASAGVEARPAARYAGQTWAVPARGELWMFGGWGMSQGATARWCTNASWPQCKGSEANGRGYLSDVWRFS
jgi:hypothetical protein